MTSVPPPSETRSAAVHSSIAVGPGVDLTAVPAGPGVYLMKDAGGRIIYVGKALNLRKRVASYFTGTARNDPKIRALVDRVAALDTILAGSEKEALILESNLIKAHRPRYNVVLKDDKRYPALRLDIRSAYPHLKIVRRIRRDGARYFGPFASAQAVRQTLRIVNRTFKLRKCGDREFARRTRPCLHYQMNACLAPCCLEVPPERYRRMVEEVVLFLKGRTPALIARLKRRMRAAAAAQDFERAAALRDKVFALQRTLETQLAVSTDLKDRDVVAVERAAPHAVLTLLTVRGGFLLGKRHFPVDNPLADEVEMLEAFLTQYYEQGHAVPPEVLVSAEPTDAAWLADNLRGLRGGAVRVHFPRRGDKRRMVDLARRNAREELAAVQRAADTQAEVTRRLQARLALDRPPRRIECFDNSALGGSEPVSAKVVFVDGRPHTDAYRRYALRTLDAPDDYAAMSEALRRRFAAADDTDPPPDLLLVDGGRGQLAVAAAVLGDLGMTAAVDLAAIAKADAARGERVDKVYRPGRQNPVPLERDPRLLLFLQRIRDEAHRFVITFQRRRRTRHLTHSVLDQVPGIGPVRKRRLLVRFGTLEGIRAAGVERIAALPGFTTAVARDLHAALTADGRQPAPDAVRTDAPAPP